MIGLKVTKGEIHKLQCPKITIRLSLFQNIWNGFKGIEKMNNIANCLTLPHNEMEIQE